MTTITIGQAADVVDRFEQLLASHGISIPRHAQTGADMLPLWKLLDYVKDERFIIPSAEQGKEFRAALAVHDLAAKVLTVGCSPHFPRLLEHLRMLSTGAVHLTEEPPAYGDAYNKLIELYWACLLLERGVEPRLDPPKYGSKGTNPDVIALDGAGAPRHGYAFKTIRSPHTESLRGHIVKGVDQIEVSDAQTGIVCLNLTPRPEWKAAWPADQVFANYGMAAMEAVKIVRDMLSIIVHDNGQQSVDAIFASKKAVGAVLCLVFLPTIAVSPDTHRPTFMPIKLATLVGLASGATLPTSLVQELIACNAAMQWTLFG